MKDLDGINHDENTVVLSGRELEMLQLTADGQTAQEIADKMFLSRRTIEQWKGKIIERAEAKNILQVIIALYKKGIIT